MEAAFEKFTGQKICWTRDPLNGPYIKVSQDKSIDELIPVERNTKEDCYRTSAAACTDFFWDR